MALVNRVQASRLYPDTSTFRTVDTPLMVTTEDRWFRIVIKAGPMEPYFADWYDSRLSHLDPRDTWHKSSGRIYRMHAKDAKPIKPFDLKKYSNTELIMELANPTSGFAKLPNDCWPIGETPNRAYPERAGESKR